MRYFWSSVVREEQGKTSGKGDYESAQVCGGIHGTIHSIVDDDELQVVICAPFSL
jgi:preprotein translocase subunit YajC